jgi:hypothetical protein
MLTIGGSDFGGLGGNWKVSQTNHVSTILQVNHSQTPKAAHRRVILDSHANKREVQVRFEIPG